MTEISIKRRAHQRFAIPHATVRYFVYGQGTLESDAPESNALMELSRGGISFLAKSALNPESVISIFLNTPGIEETLRLEGRVVHCSTSEIEPSRYFIGVEFRPFEKKPAITHLKRWKS
jgi:c-di-GMP-binding flagellar brake protein YcgR